VRFFGLSTRSSTTVARRFSASTADLSDRDANRPAARPGDLNCDDLSLPPTTRPHPHPSRESARQFSGRHLASGRRSRAGKRRDPVVGR